MFKQNWKRRTVEYCVCPSALWRGWGCPPHSLDQRLLDHRVEFIASLNACTHPCRKSSLAHLSVWLEARNLIQAGEKRHRQASLVLPTGPVAAALFQESRVNQVWGTILSNRTAEHQVVHLNPCVCQGQGCARDGVGQGWTIVLEDHYIDVNLWTGVLMEAHRRLQTLQYHQGQVLLLTTLDPGAPFWAGEWSKTHVCEQPAKNI